ncbi:MAG: hypothetical protein QOK39_485 [Acidimicrobiaceae bacterium]|jgi:hypothetical protein|nr:hypothetical protein [Acidimicrobiaceae bacterium]
MAKLQVVSYSYTCDLCGEPIAASDAATSSGSRKVSWEGSEYTVDVCATHADQLTDVVGRLKGYVTVSRRADGRRRRAATSSPSRQKPQTARKAQKAQTERSGRAQPDATAPGAAKRDDLPAIRSWAQASGLSVGVRGRLPAAIIDAYDAAQTSSAAPSAPRKRGARKATAAG